MIMVGIDVGGTFTDIVLCDTKSRQSFVHKVPTTDEPERGLAAGVSEILERVGIHPGDVDHVFHGTTIATNAVLTYEGAKTGLITTKNYRDILHIARHQRPLHYSIMQEIPWQDRPLVRRRYRKVVAERISPPDGAVEQPLDEAATREAVRELRAAGVEAIAVCFLFSYLNQDHEERAREIIHEEHPEAFVSTSASIFPQFREYERFTTAAINAFVGPKVKRYIQRLGETLGATGIEADVHVMRSNGGVATARAVTEQPVTTLLSGPAAGILGGKWVGELTQRRQLITFDVGGTSADIGLVTAEGFVEASARDTQMAGYPVMIPMIDVQTIGAGGGSIAYVDEGGAFRVGPRSAGANPGPACYGRGGTEATVTDAHVVLGRLDPPHFLGGEMTIHPQLAEEAIDALGARAHLSRNQAAEGIITIANSNMANAIRNVTIRKGHDPRDFTLVAFGGAGPLHAVEVADSLGIPEVLIPPNPGITSAMGLLTTDLKYDEIRTAFMLSSNLDAERLNSEFARLEQSVSSQLHEDGVAHSRVKISRSADCRYPGQGYELRVNVPAGALGEGRMAKVWKAFHTRHANEYGHSFPDSPVEIVSVRVVGTGAMPKLTPRSAGSGQTADAFLGTRSVFFAVDGRLNEMQTMHYDREKLPAGADVNGPAVVFQLDSTTVVPPGWSAHCHPAGSLLLTRTQTNSRRTNGRLKS